jgi:hypothetical protein
VKLEDTAYPEEILVGVALLAEIPAEILVGVGTPAVVAEVALDTVSAVQVAVSAVVF